VSSYPYLFVYGTLKSNFRNRYARRLRREAQFLGRAEMPGRLYRVKWYPGLRPARQSEESVIGEVFHLRQPVPMLRTLDEYEGKHDYARELHTATLANGRRLRCWVYMYRIPLAERRRVASGEW